MDRLTRTDKYGRFALIGWEGKARLEEGQEQVLTDAIARLAALEDKIERGEMVELPAAVGQTIYVIAACEDVVKQCDDDYYNGTGAVECPYESVCDSEECVDGQRKVFETNVCAAYVDEQGHIECHLDNLRITIQKSNIGKTAFFTEEEARAALEKETT